MAMDTAKDQIEVVGAMKQAAVALKSEVKKIDLDTIEVSRHACQVSHMRGLYLWPAFHRIQWTIWLI
jgi:hypothetical protein